MLASAVGVQGDGGKSHVKSRSELDYGPVLYEFYQQNYFHALIENETALTKQNPQAHSANGQLLKGGMLLNYGLPDDSLSLFKALLDQKSKPDVRQKAWFHLGKLYYQQSNFAGAKDSIDRVSGELNPDMHLEYHYLASLVGSEGRHVKGEADFFQNVDPKQSVRFYYLMFNLAVTELRSGKVALAVDRLEKVAMYSGDIDELLSLADRAKHGLAQMAIQAGDAIAARYYLTGIRTTGLYSNRALLTYAWTAIKAESFEEAIPALELLNSRSIAIPEVQEAKVLLAHLYEQEGSPRKALRANLLAEKAFKKGIAMLGEARKILEKRTVPREFIQNLEEIVDASNWYRANATVDYGKLTPFLIDLMSSNSFHETLKDLAALYSLEGNLVYWWSQTAEHQLILKNSEQKNVMGKLQAMLVRSQDINESLRDQKTEIRLKTLSLSKRERGRFNSLIETSEKELQELEEKIRQLGEADKPYVQPKEYRQWVGLNHKHLGKKLSLTREYILQLEPVVRVLANSELDKHESRMQYYWAQSRLAKARLYDTTLLELENARSVEQQLENNEKE
ncbi:MAG: hypothetical protein KTR17_07950 [Cellvibrionaceae bacterium]|nr:hypothetical protein [Cellvibrionaceae bacterium]